MKNLIQFISMLFLILTMNQTTYAIKYTVTNIETLGESPSFGCGINDNGQVVGDSYITGGSSYHAFVWDNDNGISNLGTIAGDRSTAYKINNSGISAGSSTIQSDNINKHATIWNIDNTTTDLGTLGGPWSSAYGINYLGKVVGLSYTDNTFTNSHAFIWDDVTGMTDIGTLGINSYARGINDNNEVVGQIILSNGITHAFIWNKDDGMKDIGTIENYSTVSFSKTNLSLK